MERRYFQHIFLKIFSASILSLIFKSSQLVKDHLQLIFLCVKLELPIRGFEFLYVLLYFSIVYCIIFLFIVFVRRLRRFVLNTYCMTVNVFKKFEMCIKN